MTSPRVAAILAALTALCALPAPQADAAGRLPTVEEADRPAFRSVRPPRPGARKGFALPVIAPGEGEGDPEPAPPPGAAARAAARAAPPSGDSAWFWDAADPAAAAADPDRLAALLATLGPRLSELADPAAAAQLARRMIAAHGPALRAAARRENLSPAFLLAVIGVESRGRAQARSPKGAAGLMQLMPATARRFGVGDAFDPEQNIAGGARYLSWLLDRFDEDALLALAAYNAGEGAVDRHAGAPPYAETRAYVPKVLAWFDALRPLCAAPPDGPRAPCALVAPPGKAAPAPVAADPMPPEPEPEPEPSPAPIAQPRAG